MSISKAELASNPYLRRALSVQDALALGLSPTQAQMAARTVELAPTPDSTEPSQPPSTKRTSKQKKPPSKPELQSQAEYQHWVKKLNRSLPPDKPLLALHFDPTIPTGTLPGWPDFTVFYFGSSKPLFLEFKRPRQGKLSPAQTLIHRYLKSLGHDLHVVFSSYAAIRLTEAHFQLPSL